MASTLKVDNLEGSTSSTVTVPAGQTFTVTDGIAIGSLPTITAVKGGTGQTTFAAGDILYANSTTTLTKLVKGSDDDVLTLASGIPSWAAAAGGGALLQLKTVYKQDTFTLTGNSGTWSDVTDVTVDITPTLSTSKILVFLTATISVTNNYYGGIIKIVRDSTTIMGGTATGSRNMALTGGQLYAGTGQSCNAVYLDNPATTSAVTYKLQAMGETATTFVLGRSGGDGDINYLGRYPTTLTVAEIAVGVL